MQHVNTYIGNKKDERDAIVVKRNIAVIDDAVLQGSNIEKKGQPHGSFRQEFTENIARNGQCIYTHP